MPQQQGSSMSETKSSQRFHSLNAEQVEVLDQVLSEVVPIHGRGNFPTLELRPRDIITAVRTRLEKQGITVRDVRLNGSTASHVLVRDNGTSYKDLDIIFGVELPRQEDFQVIKESVLGCLLDCLPAGVNRERISSATMKEAYVQKMVKVFSEHDRWSLISLSNNSGKNLELKFVSALRRQFEFSVDSFQIILDRLLECYLQQESQHTDSSVDLKDRTVENQNKDSLPLPEDATAPHTESPESTSRDLSSIEEAEISEPEQNDEMEDSLEKEPQNELSQETEVSNQTKHPKQEEGKKQKELTKMKETSEYRENSREMDMSDQASLSPLSEKKQHSDEAKPPSQAEPAQKPELSDQIECSTQVECSEQTQPLAGKQAAHSNHTEKHSAQTKQSTQTEPLEQKELINQIGCSEAPKNSYPTPTESLNLAEESHSKEHLYKTDFSECLSEDQRSNEEDKIHHLPAPDTSTSTHTEIKTHTDLEVDRKMDIETRKQIEAEMKNDTEITETTGEISTTETNHLENTQAIDDSCSTYSLSLTFPAGNTQLTGTQHTPEIHSTLHTNNSEKTPNPLDTINPPDTQDILPAPPSLVSDKKTSSLPPTKASSRLSQMVVLKHSSPKPPRRMCRKVTPNPNPNPVSETEPVIAAGLDSNPHPSPEPEIAFNPEPSIVSNPVTAPSSDFAPTKTTMTPTIINPGPEPNHSPNLAPDLDFISAPDPAPDPSPVSAGDPRSTLPQEPPSSQLNTEALYETGILSMKETLSEQVAYDELSQKDTLETSLSHTDGCNTNAQDPTHTSEAELSDEDENRDQQIKTTDLDQLPSPLSTSDEKETPLSSPSSFNCATPPISCLTPPVLSLSPPCFTSSSGSLSPPPCLTPPSHCLTSPILNVSPPPSFSPTSSSLSSPPYLTPPLLSLSPPPLCLTPPSPCLSPPLLCLTPPVETEDLAPQVSSDLEPLIQNTESEGQIIQSSSQPAVPLLQSEDEKEQDNISSLPRVPEPVSFPLTISSSTSDMLPHCQPGETGESAPPKAAEASSSEPENKEAPKVTSDKPEESKAPRASGSVPAVEVLAESMYGDFEAAMDHLRYRLIATRNPEEIRGGGLLKYSNLLVRDYRPASETQIKTLERYMCSRFFIDFPDVQEQQRKILSYLKNHFIGEERSKYQYLMTLRRVVDDSTVCLMGHERRQTLNMITVLALKVLGEQNIIPNTDHVTCFYQPAPYLAEHSAPYMAEPSYCSYYIPQGGSTLLYQPYPLHLHTQTGMV